MQVSYFPEEAKKKETGYFFSSRNLYPKIYTKNCLSPFSRLMVDPAPPIIDEQLCGPKKYHINGQEVWKVAERIEYLDQYGKLVTESLRDYSKKTLRNHYASLDEFLITNGVCP
jgi:hypothetical protein